MTRGPETSYLVFRIWNLLINAELCSSLTVLSLAVVHNPHYGVLLDLDYCH